MTESGQEFEQIYRSYFNDVFLYLKALSKDESLALELTSETYFKSMALSNCETLLSFLLEKTAAHGKRRGFRTYG